MLHLFMPNSEEVPLNMSTTRLTSKFILYIFLLVLLLPTVDLLFKVDPFSGNNEKRELSKFPGLPRSIETLQKFPREFTAYINDNFGFRNSLFIGNYLIKYGLLGTSPSDQVLIGKNGWLYYAGDGETKDSRHVSRLSEDQLRRMVMSYEIKRQWLAEQGIRYMLVIAPNKSTSYFENLPSAFNIVRSDSVIDDLKNHLLKYSSVCVIDPRDRIKEAKHAATLYYKYDSHWNNYGAFIAYSQIMEQIQSWHPGMQILSLEDFVVSKKDRKAGDIAQMIGGGKFVADEDYILTPKKSYSSFFLNKNLKARDPFTMKNVNANIQQVVVFRDSFFSALVPFLSESFWLSRYYWQNWDSKVQIEEIIEQYKPDIIIEEIAERFLKFELNDVTKYQPKWGVTYWKNKFMISKHPIMSASLDTLKAQEQVELHKTSLGLEIQSSGKDPQLVFNKLPFATGATNNQLIRVVITSSNDTDMQLFYKNKLDKHFTEEKSVKVHLIKGKNEIFIPLLFANDIDVLRLDPSTMPGEYIIQSIESRLIDNLNIKSNVH